MRTRFAPSPTGLMHPGNCRTALFNYLLARKHQGVFVVRIEDTDIQRSKQQFVEDICRDLSSLGLEWGEGPGGPTKQGQYAPYYQAQRNHIYQDFYSQLEQQGLAYPCFCSEEVLKLVRKRQLAAGEPPRYPGTCRSLTKQEVAERLTAGEQPVLRMKIADDTVLSFEDLVRGKQVFYGKHLGDFIIRRSDSSPAFMFANAIDDALMKIDCVLRGEDHLTNTPRQLAILHALDLSPPKYGHISILAGNDGSPLSKRNGSSAMRELLDSGYLPLAIINYLARLGCSYTMDELLSLDQLAEQFDLQRLVSAAARYETSQLDYWQRQALERMTIEELWSWLAAKLDKHVPNKYHHVFAELISPNILLPEEAVKWAEIIFTPWDTISSVHKDDLSWLHQKDFFTIAEQLLEQTYPAQTWQQYTQALSTQTGNKGKTLFMPLRLALTGLSAGPALDGLVTLMGKEEAVKRLRSVQSLSTG